MRSASAKRITVVAPFYPSLPSGQAPGARAWSPPALMAISANTAGADRIMSVDLHASQEQGLLRWPGRSSLRHAGPFVDYVRGRVDLSNTAGLSPRCRPHRVAGKAVEEAGRRTPAFRSQDPRHDSLARTQLPRTASSA